MNHEDDMIRASMEHVERAEACYPIAGHPDATPAEKIEITLTAQNMGAECDERDFDAWCMFVEERLPDALGLDARIVEVDQHSFKSGPASDTVRGGTDDEQAAIRSWLAYDGWDLFCATPEAWPKRG